LVINRSILHLHAHYRCFVFIIVLKTMLKSVSNLQCVHHSCLNFKFVKGLHLLIARNYLLCWSFLIYNSSHPESFEFYYFYSNPFIILWQNLHYVLYPLPQLPGNWCWQHSHLQPKLSDTPHICFSFMHYPLFFPLKYLQNLIFSIE